MGSLIVDAGPKRCAVLGNSTTGAASGSGRPSGMERAERTEVSIFMMALIADERGQDLIAYALLAGFVSLVVVATVTNGRPVCLAGA